MFLVVESDGFGLWLIPASGELDESHGEVSAHQLVIAEEVDLVVAGNLLPHRHCQVSQTTFYLLFHFSDLNKLFSYQMHFVGLKIDSGLIMRMDVHYKTNLKRLFKTHLLTS